MGLDWIPLLEKERKGQKGGDRRICCNWTGGPLTCSSHLPLLLLVPSSNPNVCVYVRVVVVVVGSVNWQCGKARRRGGMEGWRGGKGRG